MSYFKDILETFLEAENEKNERYIRKWRAIAWVYLNELGNLQTMQSQGRWSRSYIYDNVTNRLLHHEGTNNVYTYDAHGNMTSMPHLLSMTWNTSDMLRSAGNGTFSSYYSYNAAGDRVRKVVEKGNIREERLYLGNYERYRKYVNNILKTERQTVHIIDDRHRFTLIDRLTIDNGITLSSATNSIRYQYDNHLGSASLELDQTAAIISYEEYHPFGTTSYRSGRTETEVSQKRYKYVGKERDEETGLYYYGARYYAAWLCRFVSVDPLQFKYPHYTPYQYAGNKPVSYIDLDGLEEANAINDEAQKTLFFNIETGKYLGQIDNFKSTGINESDLVNGFALRAISVGDFNALKKYGEYEGDSFIPTSTVKSQSSLIRIDESSFNAFKEINKGGDIKGSPERSLFIIFDVSDKKNPVLRAVINTDSQATNKSISNKIEKYSTHSFLDGNSNYIIVGQAHTHPLLLGSKSEDLLSLSSVTFNFGEKERNAPGVSTLGEKSDSAGAIGNKFPYYAIQSYDGSGYIYKVDQWGGLNTTTERGRQVQAPVGRLDNLGKSLSQFNIILDAFLTNSGYKR